MIGIAAGLSRLGDGDEEYLFLTHPEQEEWLRPYLERALPAAPLAPQLRAPPRPGDRQGLAERIPAIGPRLRGAPLRRDDRARPASTSSTSRSRTPSPPTSRASTSRTTSSTSTCPSCSAAGSASGGRRIYRTHCERAGDGGGDDLLGPPRLHRELRPAGGEGLRSSPGARCSRSTRRRPPRDLDEMRARLSLPDSFLLYPAQTWPHKNHERLLEALALIRDADGDDDPAGLLRAADRGDFRRVRDRAARARPRGDARSSRASSARWSSAASTSSRRRSSSRAASRAGGCRSARRSPPGCPVASSSATGLPDLVGDAGLLFDPDEHRADRRCACSGSGPTRACGADLAERGREARRALQLGPHGPPVSRPLPADRRAEPCRGRPYPSGGSASRLNAGLFADVDTGSSDKRRRLRAASARSSACSPRCGRALGSIYQVVFRDRLRRHRPPDRAARLGVGRGGDPSRRRGPRPGSAARRDRAGAGRAARAAGAPASAPPTEDDEPVAARPHAG